LITLVPEENYVPEADYEDYSSRLDGLRARVVAVLPLEPRMRALDIATGSALFAIELVKRDPSLKIVAIDVSDKAIRIADRRIRERWLDPHVTTMKMDATRLEFQGRSFGLAVNFMGLDDVDMTRGDQGVRQAFHEVARVLKPRGYFCFTIIPPEEAETVAQRLEAEVYAYACGAKWLPAIRYQEYLRGAGFTLIKRGVFYTGKKLRAAQARLEIEAAIENARSHDVEALPFEDVWKKYSREIEENGLGHASRVVLMIARRNA
jgi:ubiquinone/menaquinone biosynthesis C-methylase UbiE